MPDPEYFIPIYKTCPMCNGKGEVKVLPDSFERVVDGRYIERCHNCTGLGKVPVFIELEEFADLTDMNEEALHNLKCCLRET